MRLIQPAKNSHRALGFARMFGVGKRDHLALTRFADQQDAAGAEDHHARAVNIFGKNRDVESRRRFQLREIEASFLGGKIGTSKEKEYEQKRKQKRWPSQVNSLHIYSLHILVG